MKSNGREVILVGEEHSDCSHMEGVTNLVKEKLHEYDKVVVALEQKCNSKTIEDLSKEKKLTRRQQSIQKKSPAKDTIRHNIEAFAAEMAFQDERAKLDYINSLTSITEYAKEKEKSVEFLGVDVEDELKKESTLRDKAMLKKIKKSEADCIIYPVGSAHIHCTPLEGEEPEEHGKRLGSLLLKSDYTLKIGNFYKQETEAHNSVKRDIDGFKEYHKLDESICIPSPVISKLVTEKKSEKELTFKKDVSPKSRKKESNLPKTKEQEKKLLQNKRKLPDEFKKQASDLGKSLSSQQRNVSSSSAESHIKKKVKKEETLII